MAGKNPTAELEPRFSSDDATATPWSEAARCLEVAEVSWLTTVRRDGHPHVTPVVFVWLDGALYFCTGEDER
ncbi:MAG: pyridoxamine 5'-phosphate oxidase family protein [Dehalococcoidia bacterium]